MVCRYHTVTSGHEYRDDHSSGVGPPRFMFVWRASSMVRVDRIVILKLEGVTELAGGEAGHGRNCGKEPKGH